MKYKDLCEQLYKVICSDDKEEIERVRETQRIIDSIKTLPEAYTQTADGKPLLNFQYGKISLLAEAIDYERLNMIELLLKSGANPNFEITGEAPLIFYALRKKNLEFIKLLVDAGANINLRKQYGVTALHAAIEDANFEHAKLLIEKGANPNLYPNESSVLMSLIRHYSNCNSKEHWNELNSFLQLLIIKGDVNLTQMNKADFGSTGPFFQIIMKSYDHKRYEDLPLATVNILLSNGTIITHPEVFFNLLSLWSDKYHPLVLLCLHKLSVHLKNSDTDSELIPKVEAYLQEVQNKISERRVLTQETLNINGVSKAAIAELIIDYEMPFFERRNLVKNTLIANNVPVVVADLIADYETPSPPIPVFFKSIEKPKAIQHALPSIKDQPIDRQEEAKLQIKCSNLCSLM